MTLTELRAAHPQAFHPNQDWFFGESFMDRELPDDAPTELPRGVAALHHEFLDELPDAPPPAVTLANIYVNHPEANLRHYFWTSDFDHQGQRVYIGDNGQGIEIHRHLRITPRWRLPVW